MICVRPLKAIRLKCYDCSGWNFGEVKRCVHEDCILWPLRFGKKPKGIQYKKLLPKQYAKIIENH